MNNINLRNKIKICSSILFDMDGIITDTMPEHCLSWITAFKNFFNIEVSKQDIYLREGEKSEISVLQILKNHEISISSEKTSEFLNYKSSLFNARGAMPLFEGIEKCLKFLCKTKKIGLVTGTPRHELQARFPKKLYQFFDVIITSTDISNGKPHPEPYLKALKVLDEKQENALVIENAPYGIKSALNANIEVLAIPTSLSIDKLTQATYLCDSHAEFFKIIFEEIN